MKKLWFGMFIASLLLISLASADVFSDNNLTAYFTFDILSTQNTFKNSIDANYNISSISNPIVSDGINNNAILCLGVNASYPDLSTLYAPNDEYSYSFWAYINNTEDGAYQSMVQDYFSGSTRGWIGFNTGSDLIYAEPNPSTPLTTNYSIVANTWVHVVLTSKPNEHRIYVDGDLYGESSSVFGRPTNVNGTYAVCGSPFNSNMFLGAIDEVSFFDKAINESAVQEIHNSGLGNFPFEEAETPEFNLTDCGFLRDSGTYYVQENLTITDGGGTCFDLLVSNIIIEGNGNTIFFNATTDGEILFEMGSSFGGDNQIIRNLNVVAYYDTHYNYAAFSVTNREAFPGISNNLTIENVNITNFRIGIEVYGEDANQNVTDFTANNINILVNDEAVIYDFYDGFLSFWGYTHDVSVTNANLILDGVPDFNWFQFAGTNPMTNMEFSNINLKQNGVGSILLDGFTFDNSIDENINMSNNGIVISENYVAIYPENFAYLNSSASITLNNLAFTNPRILRNGEICAEDICSNLLYSLGTATFDVAGWSNYTLEESPEEPSVVNTPIYQVMDSGGAGLGIFFQYLARALPILMLALVVVSIIVIIGYSLVNVVRKAIVP
jgi:hypothetical protein